MLITLLALLPVSMQLARRLQLPCAVETRAASQRRVSCLAARHMPSLAQRLNHDARMTAGEASPAAVQLASTAGLVARVKPAAHGQQRRPLTPPSAASGAAGSASDSPNMGAVLTAVAVACMGAFAFGYHLGVVNGPLEAIAKELGFLGNQALSGLVVSSTLAGAALGSLTGGGFADALGRRASFMLCALPMLVGPLLSATANSLNMMVAGRFLAGIAIGLSSALVPLYISEVAPTSMRGTLGSLNQLMICLGILAALVVNVALPVTSWRTMFMLAAVPAALLFLGMLGSPESPGYLAAKGKRDEAVSIATKLWGAKGVAQLGESAGGSKGGASGGGESLLSATYRKGVLMGCVLFVFQQFSGINAIVYFSSSVFKQAGIASGALASAAVGATNVAGTLIATSLIEGAGRKQLLLSSYLGMAATMALMAAGFGLPALAGYSGVIALVGTLGYILSFAIGAGPVTGLIVPEINKEAVRGNAVSAAMVTHWVCNVAIGQNFMAATESYGISAVYAFFGVCSLVAAAWVSSNVPETKGKSFAEIQAEMDK